MKKKILIAILFAVMTVTITACDLLSTIVAVKGFYDEYQTYSEIYNNATQMTVRTETNLTITDTNIDDMLPVSSSVYFMLDQDSPFLYVEQDINGDARNSVYESADGLYVEYIIDDNNVVTPTLPEGDQFNSNVSILNENFSYEDVSNENKTGDHTYEFDVYLNQAVNLDALNDFVNQLKVFDENLEQFNNAIAHVVITFTEAQSTIDIQAAVTDYTVTFDDESTVTFSITNHTILQIPDDFAIPDVFSDDYQMKAVDNVLLARKAYEPGQMISYPATADENGWIQLNLEAGTYELTSAHFADFTMQLFDAEQNEIVFTEGETPTFAVSAAGSYYLYVMPTASFEMDLTVVAPEV